MLTCEQRAAVVGCSLTTDDLPPLLMIIQPRVSLNIMVGQATYMRAGVGVHDQAMAWTLHVP
jgi:hypothetical protein